jgi:tetraacyldisaccharide 4'-kinase
VALAGIAGPARFTRALGDAGWTVARTRAFRDHHRYGARDLAAIARDVAETGAAGVLTTAKDAVRLLPLRPLPVPVALVPLDVSIEPAGAFRAWLLDRLSEARACR